MVSIEKGMMGAAEDAAAAEDILKLPATRNEQKTKKERQAVKKGPFEKGRSKSNFN